MIRLKQASQKLQEERRGGIRIEGGGHRMDDDEGDDGATGRVRREGMDGVTVDYVRV